MSFYFNKAFSPSLTVAFLCLSAVLNFTALAHSADNASIEVTSFNNTIKVAKDGSYVREWTVLKRLLDKSALDDFSKTSFYFNDRMMSLEILEAEVIKKGGRHIQIKPEQIRLQEDPATMGLSVFNATKVKTIIFPDIEVGDSVRFHVKKQQAVPFFTGQYTYEDWISPDEQILSYKLTLIAPKDMKFNFKSKDFIESHSTDKNGNNVWNWSTTQTQSRFVEDGKANRFQSEPHIAISSFQSWQEVAGAYNAHAGDKVDVTPEIQKLADDLTKGVTDRREQTRILYDWVRSNIRYIALYVSNGGYVPHFSYEILQNRYGDCKDHVVLLEALLKAKNIHSQAALISAATDFQAYPVPSLEAFDHVITYVPEFDLYLDSTQQYLPFGVLNYGIAAKPVLNIADKTELTRTPTLTAEKNRRITSLKVTFNADASFSATQETVVNGGLAVSLRYATTQINPQIRKDFIKMHLGYDGLTGDGTLKTDPVDSDENDFHWNIDFNITKSALNFSVPETLFISSPLEVSSKISSSTTFFASQPDSQFSTAAVSQDLTDNYSIQLPDNVKVIYLPKPVSLRNDIFEYTADYQQQGNLLTIKKHYIIHSDKGYLTPNEIARSTEIGRAIRNDLQAKVLVMPVDG